MFADVVLKTLCLVLDILRQKFHHLATLQQCSLISALRDLSNKIAVTLQPIFVNKKLEQDLKPKEIRPSIVSQHCVVYKFACDPCDADYIGYTARHLHQRIAEHKYSTIGKHLLEMRGDKNLLYEGQFRVLKKRHGKFNCLVYEMQFIKELGSNLNTQSDSFSAKLFV